MNNSNCNAFLNETHDPELRSWVKSSSDCPNDFPIQNLPFAVFRSHSNEDWRIGVGIEDQMLDLTLLFASGLTDQKLRIAFEATHSESLNQFISLGRNVWSDFRLSISKFLRVNFPHKDKVSQCLLPINSVEFKLPVKIGDYTDFYASTYHARNCGLIRGRDNPLTPNYPWVPIAYHGRASSVIVSDEEVFWPKGQLGLNSSGLPRFGFSEKMDFELEMAIYIGASNQRGESISIGNSENHIFGMGLLNDWSARDVQLWEAAPLGPFLGKNFATTVSPWVVTWEALQPFRTALKRDPGFPDSLDYLHSEFNERCGALDIDLTASIQTATMRQENIAPETFVQTNLKYSHWTVGQLVSHHTVGGCNLNVGDVFGTGTLSGPDELSRGCLLEISRDGQRELKLSNGETRTYLEEEDRIVLNGKCVSKTHVPIGFGACSGFLRKT